MKVISLSALCPQSGKDTLADFIETIEGIKVRRIAFGDDLRSHVIRMFNHGKNSLFHETELKHMLLSSKKDIEHEAFAICKLPDHDNSGHCIDTYRSSYRLMLAEMVGYDPVEMTKPRSLRYHMQRYGNDFTKDKKGKKTYWIDQVSRKLAEWERQGIDLVVITDTRAPEEFEELTKYFQAKTFLIKREGFPFSAAEALREHHPIEDFAKNFKYDWELSNVYGDKSIMQADFLNIYNNYL